LIDLTCETQVSAVIALRYNRLSGKDIHVWLRRLASHLNFSLGRQPIFCNGILPTNVDKRLLCYGSDLGLHQIVGIIFTTKMMIKHRNMEPAATGHAKEDDAYFFEIWTTKAHAAKN
jgi:hypothetical protein